MRAGVGTRAAFPLALIFLFSTRTPAGGADKKPEREEGEFRIIMSGKDIGNEKYVIVTAGDSASSSSTLDFRNPGETHQRVQLETKLEMDGHFTPKSYQLKSDVDGKRGTILGTFAPNQAMFEYSSTGPPRKSGLLTGNEFTLLDTNIFHHFTFLARLFKYDNREKVQRFEVVIPQETDSGVLKIKEVGRETIQMRGKKLEAYHLQLDSGSLLINLWVDSRHVVQRISVPSKGIEVSRN